MRRERGPAAGGRVCWRGRWARDSLPAGRHGEGGERRHQGGAGDTCVCTETWEAYDANGGEHGEHSVHQSRCCQDVRGWGRWACAQQEESGASGVPTAQ